MIMYPFSFVYTDDEGMQYLFGECIFVSVNRRLSPPRLTFLVDPEECEGNWPECGTRGSGHIKYQGTIIYFESMTAQPSVYLDRQLRYWLCVCDFVEYRDEEDP